MYDQPMPYAYQDLPITEDSMFVLTDDELRQIDAIQDRIHDLAGDYPNFVTLDDAQNFVSALEDYIEVEGYSPSDAYDLVMKDMDL